MTEIYARHRSDSPLYGLCIDAANLEHIEDWPTLLIEPDENRVTVQDDSIMSDWPTVEFINGTPTPLELIVDSPYGSDEWDLRFEWMEPANIITPYWLHSVVFDGGRLTEPAIIQPQVYQTYDCDDCRDVEDDDERDALQCDHIAGWVLAIARHV